jgi:hypothetical protein
MLEEIVDLEYVLQMCVQHQAVVMDNSMVLRLLLIVEGYVDCALQENCAVVMMSAVQEIAKVEVVKRLAVRME